MKLSTRDEVEGKFRDMKGKVDEQAGHSANGPDCPAEGPKIAAKVQRGIAQTAEMHEEFAPDLGKE